jgi:hypothetical protein
MYCKVCQACFRSFWKLPKDQEHIHQRNYSSLSLSSDQGCRLCMDLMECIMNSSEPQPEPPTVWDWTPSWRGDQREQIFVYILPNLPPGDRRVRARFSTVQITKNCPLMTACDAEEGNEIPWAKDCYVVSGSTGSRETWSQISYWLSECNRTHGSDCNPGTDPEWVPSRLLNVHEAGKVYLQTEFLHGPVQYVTLSHRWGNTGNEQLKLTSHNLLSLQHSIKVHSLSQSFQDAISITRRMGVSYLWIDSLCIMQGDKPDWQHEASRMGKVYSNGVLNISVHSDDPKQGCFRIWDPSRVKSFLLDSRSPQEPFQLRSMYSEDFWYDNVDFSPVNQRGWV